MIDNDQIISMIRQGKTARENAIRMLYNDQKLVNGVRKVVTSRSNKEEEFRDVFNHALVQFMKRVIEKPDFELKSNIHSYIFGISRNIWLMKLRSRKNNRINEIKEGQDFKSNQVSIDLQIINEERKKNLSAIIAKLGVKCKELLKLWASNYKMNEISKLLGYSNEGAVRKKKFDCMKKLNKILLANPSLKEKLK